MTVDPSILPEVVPTIVGIILATAGVASLYRALRGPSLADRVVALDTIGFIIIGILLVLAIDSGQKSLISIALIAALILFLGTVAFAIYLERRGGE
jgi:multicomponent Na+:H+ antiporter subunit F